ncbi:hypothetical protein, partial [Neisseria sicca]|uniref:hypothetical protein n=1 Tax=Neisseria sicca TaxID=490 RepID=UPI0016499FDF
GEDVEEDIETTWVCHRDDELLKSVFRWVLNEVIERGNESVGGLKGEGFVREIFGMEVRVESVGRGDLFEDAGFVFGS